MRMFHFRFQASGSLRFVVVVVAVVVAVGGDCCDIGQSAADLHPSFELPLHPLSNWRWSADCQRPGERCHGHCTVGFFGENWSTGPLLWLWLVKNFDDLDFH